MTNPGDIEKILAAFGAKNDKQELADHLRERALALMEARGEFVLPVDVMLQILETRGSKALPLPRKDKNFVN